MAQKRLEVVCPIKHKLLESPASELLRAGPITLSGQLSITVDDKPELKLVSAQASKQLKLWLADATREVGSHVATALQTVTQLHQQDQRVENPGAFEQASQAVGSLNDTLSKLLSVQLASQFRGAIVKRLRLDPKRVSLQLGSDFEPIGLDAGRFRTQNPLLPDLYGLKQAIKRKRWQHCGVVSKGKLAYLLVDRKKPVKKGPLKALKKGMGMGGGVIAQGFCRWQGGRLVLRFLARDASAAPNKTQLKLGLLRQLGEGVKAVVSCDLESLPKDPRELPPPAA